MKILIWVGCILAAGIIGGTLTSIIGLRFGMIGGLIEVGIACVCAKKLCEKWDERE